MAPLFGGFAQTGRVVAGEYYLGNHGQYVRVSQELFEFVGNYKAWTDRALGLVLVVFVLASVAVEHRARRWLSERKRAATSAA